jgi:hypothetical protein
MDFIDCSSGTDTGAVAADYSANEDSNKRSFALAIIKEEEIFYLRFSICHLRFGIIWDA